MKKVVDKLILSNYRSHAYSEIDFDDRTIIEPEDPLKPNDCGKTHIIRALRMILFHENFPITHLKYGTKEGFVEVHLSSGYKVKRSWTKEGHFTCITDPKGEELVIKGTNDATAYVKQATGFSKVKLEETGEGFDFNFLGARYNGPLLTERSDIVLKKISLLMGCQPIEEAVTLLVKESNKLKSEIETLQDIKTSKESSLILKDKLAEEITKKLKLIEELEEEINVKTLYVEKVQKLVKLAGKLGATQKLNSIVKTYSSVKEAYDQKLSDLKKLIHLKENYQNTLANISKYESDIVVKKDTVTSLLNEKQALLKKLGICPLCNKEQG